MNRAAFASWVMPFGFILKPTLPCDIAIFCDSNCFRETVCPICIAVPLSVPETSLKLSRCFLVIYQLLYKSGCEGFRNSFILPCS